MNRAELTFRFDTPAFLHDGDGKTARFRTFSFKGALRFWLRAVLWSECRNVEEVRKIESSLMGSTERASRVEIRLIGMKRSGERLRTHNEPLDHPGLAYLAGQGIHHYKECWVSEYLHMGTEVTLAFRFHGLTAREQDRLNRALQAFFLFGGLGQRSRRGFGSCTPVHAGGLDLPDFATLKRIQERVRSFQGDFNWNDDAGAFDPDALPPYTAFSRYTWVRTFSKSEIGDPVRLLEEFGKAMLRFRSRRSRGDRDTVLKYISGKFVDSPPARAVFGLPHNYYFQRTKTSVKIDAVRPGSGKDPDELRRRAGPLFAAVHRFEDGQAGVVTAFLPARFLPEDLRIRISSKSTKPRFVKADWRRREFWKPIAEFQEELPKST